ncbi:phage tail tape measure protein [Sutcliffiella horikoshii]|uniref:phage tail tape measure protein n=1 Tax=Sutcliffiella horikoshii TaxID=79883 RepID=UPI003CEA0902
MAEEIAKLKIGFSLDSSQLEKGMGHVLSNLNLMQKEFKSSMVGVDKYNKSLDDLGKEAKGLKGILDQQKIALASIQNQYDKTNESLEKNEKQVNDLRKAYEDAKKSKSMDEEALKKLENEYQNAVKMKQKDEKALKSLHGKYIDMTTQVKKTELALEDVNKKIKDKQFSFKKLNDGIGKASKSMRDIGGTMTTYTKNVVGATLKTAAFATAIAGAFAVSTVKKAAQVSDSIGDLQIQLGVTEKEAKNLQGIAKNLWLDGWDELPNLTNNIAIIRQQMKELSDKEIEGVTKAITLMNDKFGTDTNEVTRTIDTMMKNLGVSSEEATDILIAGFQNGLDSTGEWLDVMREYSPHFKEMGIDGQKAFHILKKSMDAGAWSLDKVADLLKEGHIRMQDMSEATSDAYEEMGLSSDKYAKRIAKGGEDGAKALQEVFRKLQGVKDETKRNELAVALFGTQYEDLREDIMWAMLDGMESTEKLGKVTQDATKIAEESFGQKWAGAMAKLSDAFTPLGIILLDLIEKHMPDIQKAIEKFSDVVKNIDWQKFIDGAKEIYNTIMPPLKKAFENIWNIIKDLDSDTFEMIATVAGISLIAGPVISAIGLIGGAFVLLTGKVGLLLLGIGSLIAGFMWIKENVDEIVAAMKYTDDVAMEILKGAFGKRKELTQEEYDELLKQHKKGNENINKAQQKGSGDILSSLEIGNDKLVTEMQQTAKLMTNAVNDGVNGKSIGGNLVDGIALGIEGKKSYLRTIVEGLGKSVDTWIKSYFKIKSPSQKMRDEVGIQLGNGLAVGMERSLPKIKGATAKMSKASIPKVPDVSLPANVRNGSYASQTNNSYSNTVNVSAISPQDYIRQTERMLRRQRFQGGIA